MAKMLVDYVVEGKVTDKLADRNDVELALKVFSTTQNWYDKTINNPGNLSPMVDTMKDADKKLLMELKTLEEAGIKRYKT